VRRMRPHLATARGAVKELNELDSSALLRERDGTTPLLDALDNHLNTWSWRLATMANLLAREDAILAVDETASWLLPDERARLSEAVESARASLAWVRRHEASFSSEPKAGRAQRRRALRRELAAAFWAIDIVEHVGAGVFERALPRTSPLVAGDVSLAARIGRWSVAKARGVLFWRRRRRGLDAHRAISTLHTALRSEGGHLWHSISEPGAIFQSSRDPRIPPPPHGPSRKPDRDRGEN
jgi:hypothetical protein